MSTKAAPTEQATLRRDVADAVLRVVARAGIAAVSMRVVATEADMSLGLLQRTIGTKGSLLALAMDRVIERADARIEAAGLNETLPARAFLEALTEVLLDNDDSTTGIVWAAFVAHALVDPNLADVLRRQERDGMSAIALVLRAAQSAGDLDPQLDLDREALGLLALVNGLGVQLLLGTCDRNNAQAAVRAHLDRLFSRSA